jgi:hypothetical protein
MFGYISCELKGGLGNQIFQIFAVISYAKDNYMNFCFKNNDFSQSDTPRSTYWKSFFHSLKPFLHQKIFLHENINFYTEPNFSFSEIPKIPVFHSMMLYGYFQSEKYFKHNFDFLCDVIDLYNLKQKLLIQLKDKINFHNSVSLHFRKGDYKKASYFHPILTNDYYKKALHLIPKNIQNVIYFCEDEDIDEVNQMIDELKQIYSHFIFQRCKFNLEDWEELIAMSLCTHNIIANSSFSWWGAYFNSNENKIVCRPKLWFHDHSINLADLCPNSWITIH